MEVDVLVRKADAAMYQAKADGRNRSHFYTNAMTAYAQERIQLEGLLRDAITSNEVSVHFQPKVEVESGRLLAAEALLRWDSAELGSIPPTRFIPLAEETGFQSWSWDSGYCAKPADRSRSGTKAGAARTGVSINLSVKQLERGNLPELLRTIMRETGITPERLELEITESVIMGMEDCLRHAGRPACLGRRLALDDFGTGYSSLSYLRKLPVQTLKIDQGFNRRYWQESQATRPSCRPWSISPAASSVQRGGKGWKRPSSSPFCAVWAASRFKGFLFGTPVSASEFQLHWQARTVVDMAVG